MAIPLTRSIAGTEVPAAGLWAFDAGHTEAAFAGTHLMINRVRGRFDRVTGWLDVAENPERSKGELVIDTRSLTSGFRDRDEHLKSGEWLDVDNHPRILYRSTGLEFVAGRVWRLAGDLTVKDITHPVEARATFGGGSVDPWGHEKIGFAVAAEMDRELWDLRWNLPLDAGGWVVSRRVWLTVNVEAVRADLAASGEAG
ncbi:MAG: YceI family protein [Candidatus Dormibacteraeota bacterium]|nr:YceI family protein [Candidatus Dormibacteraeota bacterium]